MTVYTKQSMIILTPVRHVNRVINSSKFSDNPVKILNRKFITTSARGHEKVVQMLLDRGADVNA
jgi:hypothetical protein